MSKKFKSRLLSFVTAMVLTIGCIGGAVPAMAAEVDDTTNAVVESMEHTEEAEMLRAKINQIVSEKDKSRDTYKTDYWGYTKIYGSEFGGKHTIYGHQARLCIAIKPSDGNTVRLGSTVNSNNNTLKLLMTYDASKADADGYHMFVGDWVGVNYMGQYQLYYSAYTLWNTSELRGAEFHVWIDYK